MKPAIFALLLLLQLLAACPHAQAATAPLLIDFIDVGEGDALLVRTPDSQAFLVDTGNLVSGFDVLSFIQSQKLSKLDALFLTHPHLDHIGGAFAILKLFNVERVYDNGENAWPVGVMQDIERWYHELVRSKKDYRVLKQGDILRFGDLKLQVLSPPLERRSNDWNTNSLVLLLEYGSFKALLMGDANKAAEKVLLEEYPGLGPVQLVKVGHHGAKDTGSKAFLKKISPKAAIISTNKNNIRGYPAPETLERLKQVNTLTFITSQDGNIRVEAFPSGSFHIIFQGKIKKL